MQWEKYFLVIFNQSSLISNLFVSHVYNMNDICRYSDMINLTYCFGWTDSLMHVELAFNEYIYWLFRISATHLISFHNTSWKLIKWVLFPYSKQSVNILYTYSLHWVKLRTRLSYSNLLIWCVTIVSNEIYSTRWVFKVPSLSEITHQSMSL